jgi:hypothetical protein
MAGALRGDVLMAFLKLEMHDVDAKHLAWWLSEARPTRLGLIDL